MITICYLFPQVLQILNVNFEQNLIIIKVDEQHKFERRNSDIISLLLFHYCIRYTVLGKRHTGQGFIKNFILKIEKINIYSKYSRNWSLVMKLFSGSFSDLFPFK